jgi:hypothetical protein
MSTQHEGFKDRHNRSVPALIAVAAWFHKRSFSVSIPGFKQAPTADRHEEFADKGDLFLREDDRWKRVEVHHYSYLGDWTCAAEYKDDFMFLKNVDAADKIGIENIDRVIILNKSWSHMAWVWYATTGPWNSTYYTPANTGNPELKYYVDPSAAIYMRFDDETVQAPRPPEARVEPEADDGDIF